MPKLFLLHLGLLLSLMTLPLTTFADPDKTTGVSAVDGSVTGLPETNLGVATEATILAQDPHTEICMAAFESKNAVRSKAFELKIGRRELNKIRCNDMSVMAFAKQHGDEVNNWSIATVQ